MEQKQKSVSPFSNDSRNAYVVERLTAAMLKRMEEKPIAEISISELCDMAEVGRTSFYRNFKSREDILRRYIRWLIEAETWFHQDGDADVPLPELIRRVFSHLEQQREFYALLNRQGLVYLLKDAILDICEYDPAQEEAAWAYSKAFVAYSLYGWIDVWFQRGMRESTQELVALFSQVG